MKHVHRHNIQVSMPMWFKCEIFPSRITKRTRFECRHWKKGHFFFSVPFQMKFYINLDEISILLLTYLVCSFVSLRRSRSIHAQLRLEFFFFFFRFIFSKKCNQQWYSVSVKWWAQLRIHMVFILWSVSECVEILH